MPPKAPAFWSQNGMVAKLLSPLSCLYGMGHALKWRSTKPYRAHIPVVCVGGITAGGSGKTPTLHALLDIITRHDLYQKPVVLLRGYGGSIKTPTQVNSAIHTLADVGDEALLHAALTTTIIAANRADGAKLAEKIGADIIVMDDGLQNNSLEKTLSLLVIDGDQGLGNGRLLPAGPLREKIETVLPRIAAIVQIGNRDHVVGKPILRATIMPRQALGTGTTYFGFAGLGRPEKFRQTLLGQGITLAGFVPFADHHPYNDADIIALKAIAGKNTLITTSKDYVRIPPSLRDGIEVLPVILTFEDEAAVTDQLKALS